MSAKETTAALQETTAELKTVRGELKCLQLHTKRAHELARDPKRFRRELIAGAVGAFGAGLTSEAARWLWATFLAVVSSGWATLAAWWNS